MFRDLVAALRDGRGSTVDARPLTGGLNNTVFAVGLPDGSTVCCKLYRDLERQQDLREWNALSLLAEAEPGLAPTPLHHEPGAVVMSFVEGTGLGGHALDAAQVTTLADALHRLYRVPAPSDALPAGDAASFVERIRRLHGSIAAASDDANDPAVVAAGRWLATAEPEELAGLDRSVFGRGDPNLANCLWHDGGVTFVDWEDSGRASRAFELGDLIEHIQSRGTPDTTWAELVDRFDLDRAEQRELVVARRLLAVFWLLLLQPGQAAAAINPVEARGTQSGRVLALLDAPG